MSNIANYSSTECATPPNYVKLNGTTQKVQKFAEYLHNFLPVLEEEFNDLENMSKSHSNKVFPIKMSALASIYQAAKPLYEWYVEKAKN